MMAKKIKKTFIKEETVSLTIKDLSFAKENLKQEVTAHSYFKNYDSMYWLNLLDKEIEDELDQIYYD